MKPVCPLCVSRKIQVLAEQGLKEYDGVSFGDLGVHPVDLWLEMVRDGVTVREHRILYAMVHLPSGLGLVNVNCLFWKQSEAEDAMMEIARLKNYWSFENKDEANALIPQIREIGAKHGGFNIPGTDVKEAESYRENLNGYDNSSSSQQ